MITKQKARVLVLYILIFLFLFFYYYVITKSFVLEETLTLPQKASSNKSDVNENAKFIMKDHSSFEKIKGWLGDKILIKYEALPPNGAIFVYEPELGKKDLIAEFGDYYGRFNGSKEIQPYSLMKGKKMMLHHIYRDNYNLIIEFNTIRKASEDYSYFSLEEVVDQDNVMRKAAEQHVKEANIEIRDTKSYIEIYDVESKKADVIYEYNSKYRIVEGVNTGLAFNSFQGVGFSNNGEFLVFCTEMEVGRFEFSVYNVLTKTTKKYSVYEEQGRFSLIENIGISNDGKTIWFKSQIDIDLVTEKQFWGAKIYQIKLDDKHNDIELVADNAVNYKTTYDNRYLVYDKSYEKEDISTNGLFCVDLLTIKEFKIDEDIISCYKESFDISNSGLKVAYLKKVDSGAKIYLSDVGIDNPKKISINSFSDFESLKSIDWDEKNQNILISYSYKSASSKSDIYNICVVSVENAP